MKRSTLLLCFLVAVGDCFLRELVNVVPEVVKDVGETLNPVQLLYVNRCIQDLGCFYTGPPFHHGLYRPISLPPASNPIVKFHLFTPSNKEEAYFLDNTLESLENSTFDPTFQTKFIIHGFMSDLDYDDVRFQMKDSLLKLDDFNVILVDWTAANGLPYSQAVANTRVVGAIVARLIHFLMNETGITADSVHIIGHSLGAHTAGYAGERIPHLGRITGLDPAAPYFQDLDPEVRLDVTDADFVDVIHSDGAEFILEGLGISAPIGHMDFYPNGGRRQPGCVFASSQDNAMGKYINYTTKWIQNGCDHGRANAFFQESILNSECRFLAVECPSYKYYEHGLCSPENSTVTEMGFHAQKPYDAPPVRFYLRTKAESPYCQEDSIFLRR
ncbi:inactive pancreatic lipase-related protein 1 [Trichonephila clavata]|uniref:Inactive pancreatic lipase-related protein 1 n=1 Tax=Trichonephila clavata TaxID=2740835 RepID=A0A8X6HUF4_TRICU|nr:inactive pancreatic lipase-related protein 1 [Trichonephila clavata]